MIHVLINPAAGSGLAARIGALLLEALESRGVIYTVSHTEYPGHATTLARAAAENGAATVVAVGGDGTVCETARGLLGTDAALGIVPGGTGNDVVKMLGTPQKAMDAMEFILTHPARRLDAGEVNGELFLNVCGTGFDVCALEYALRAKRYVRGILPYLWGTLCAILSFRPPVVTYEMEDGERKTGPLLLIAVANGKFVGGGIEIAPQACPADGLLDLVVIENMPNWRMPAQLPKLLTGNVMKIPGAAHRRCTRVTVAARGMRLNIDGEIVSVDRASFATLPCALLAHW